MRNLPNLEPLPISSPSYPSSRSTSQRATLGYSDDGEPLRYHKPRLFGKILKPERYLRENHQEEPWDAAERDAMNYEMEQDQLQVNPNTLRGQPLYLPD